MRPTNSRTIEYYWMGGVLVQADCGTIPRTGEFVNVMRDGKIYRFRTTCIGYYPDENSGLMEVKVMLELMFGDDLQEYKNVFKEEISR